MINIYWQRSGSGGSTISIHQGDGDATETEVWTFDLVNWWTDVLLEDFANGAVTVHDEGVTP